MADDLWIVRSEALAARTVELIERAHGLDQWTAEAIAALRQALTDLLTGARSEGYADGFIAGLTHRGARAQGMTDAGTEDGRAT